MTHPLKQLKSFLCRLRVSCSYSVSSNALPVNVLIITVPPPLAETQPGPLALELHIAKGKSLSPGASGLHSESCHSSGHKDPPLVIRHLSEEFVWVRVCLKQPRSSKVCPYTFSYFWPLADKNYSSYYSIGDYPVVKLLRDPIYVEVSIRHRTDPSLGLLLHQCWATPSADPLQQPQWPLLVKG